MSSPTNLKASVLPSLQSYSSSNQLNQSIFTAPSAVSVAAAYSNQQTSIINGLKTITSLNKQRSLSNLIVHKQDQVLSNIINTNTLHQFFSPNISLATAKVVEELSPSSKTEKENKNKALQEKQKIQRVEQ